MALKVSSRNMLVLPGSCGPGTMTNISAFDALPVQCLVNRRGRGVMLETQLIDQRTTVIQQ